MRTRKWLALFVCLACLLASGQAYSAPVSGSLLPPVVRPSQLSEAYARAQADPGISDSDKIRNTIDTLETARYDSIKNHQVIDIGFLYNDQHSHGIGSLEYEMGRISLAVVNEIYFGLQAESYSYLPEYTSIDMSGTTATVVMTPYADFVYGGHSGGYLSTEHTFVLVKSGGQWKIDSDQYSDEMTESYPADTDFANVVKGFRKAQDDYLAKCKKWLEDTKGDFKANPRQAGASAVQLLSGIYAPKNTSALQTYARQYTEDSHDYTHDKYNALFREDLGNDDCMDFASQCIWAMFGGDNSQTAIQGRYSPMVYNISGANPWWCTHTASVTSWTYIPDFKTMLFDNSNFDKIGVQGTIGTLFDTRVGDLVDHISIGHVYVITEWLDNDHDGTVDWGELQECSHTHNHKDFWLHSTITLSDARFTYIQRCKISN